MNTSIVNNQAYRCCKPIYVGDAKCSYTVQTVVVKTQFGASECFDLHNSMLTQSITLFPGMRKRVFSTQTKIKEFFYLTE